MTSERSMASVLAQIDRTLDAKERGDWGRAAGERDLLVRMDAKVFPTWITTGEPRLVPVVQAPGRPRVFGPLGEEAAP